MDEAAACWPLDRAQDRTSGGAPVAMRVCGEDTPQRLVIASDQ